MREARTAVDALESAMLLVEYGACFNKRNCPLPGSVYAKLPVHLKELLKTLKSDDLEKLRLDYIKKFL